MIKDNYRHQNGVPALLIIGSILFIATFVLFVPLLQKISGISSAEHEKLAHFGEAYIIWHSLFDTIACVFLGWTLRSQLKEARNRDLQFAQQLETQRMQSVFFPYLALFNDHVKALAINQSPAFVVWMHRLEKDSGDEGINRFVHDNQYELLAYLRHLTALLEFILKSKINTAEKSEYIRLLHAHLSEEEVEILKKCLRLKICKNLLTVLDQCKKSGLNVEWL